MFERPLGSLRLAQRWDELRKLNFLWVAANDNGVFASNAQLEVLMDEVDRRGLADQAVYALVDFDEPLGDEPAGPAPEGPPSCEPPRLPSRGRSSW